MSGAQNLLTYEHVIYINDIDNITFSNIDYEKIYKGAHINGEAAGTPAAFYKIESVAVELIY